MAPGPPDKSPNRFHLLGEFLDNPPKKHRLNDFPDLPTPRDITPDHPKYILISSTEPEKPLSKFSPFAIKKGVECISKEYSSISQLRDGNVLILARNTRVAEKFIKTNTLANLCKISCKLHNTLNSIKGVIFAPCLRDVPESEIVQEMKEQAVTDVYKFTKLAEDGLTRKPTGKIVLTFDLYRLPATVDVAWYKCRVDFYYPNPMFCKNCQRLGHTKKRCRGSPTCPQCSLPPHDATECIRTLCSNCSENHFSNDKNCPRFLQMKEILKIKTKNYCSISEARRRYRENNPVTSVNQTASFSSTVKNSNAVNPKHSAETSPSIPDNQPSTSKKIQNLINSKTSQEKQSLAETNKTTSLKKYTTSMDSTKTPPVKDQPSLDTLQHSENSSKSSYDKQPSTVTNTTTSLKKYTPSTETSKIPSTKDSSSETPKHSSTSRQKLYTSPLSTITKNLLEKNQYYLPLDSTDVTTMDLEN